MESLSVPQGKKVYFASDFHLGIPDEQRSRNRELQIVSWLDSIRDESYAIFLLGDLFDTWFEYKTVVPRGFVRLLGKLAELSDLGIRIDIFTGNHDFWMKDYFQKELGANVHFTDIEIEINSKKFNVGHGDGLGPGDKRYKALKKILSNPVSKFTYMLLHPYVGIKLASWFSQKGAKHDEESREIYMGSEKEYLVQYSKQKNSEGDWDYFIFGHRHIPIKYKFTNGTYYFNTGDWIRYHSYVVFDGSDCELLSFTGNTDEFITDHEEA